MEGTIALLIPIFICVVLPVAIVWINARKETAADKMKADIILKAIETNNELDANALADSLKKPKKTAREILNGRLLRGCIWGLVGLFICIVGIVNLCTGSEFSADPVTVPLIFGGASLAVGIGFLIVYFATRKQVLKDSEE